MAIPKKKMYLLTDCTIRKILLQHASFPTYYQNCPQLISLLKSADSQKFQKGMNKVKIYKCKRSKGPLG